MKVNLSKCDNIKSADSITTKLRIMDYVFCYKGIDLKNAELEYCFSKIQSIEFKDGEISKEQFSPVICFSINAQSDNDNTCAFEFMVNMNVDSLNEFPNKPTNINEYIVKGETFFWDSYNKQQVPEFMDFALEENIYSFTSYFSVQKLEDRKFAFKIQYQDLFIWFHIDFNEK